MGKSTATAMTRAIRDRCYRFKEEWEGFWFTPRDSINVSLLRILVGSMTLYSLLVWSLDLQAFFSQQHGWQSARIVQTLQQHQWAFSFWWYVPDGYLWVAHTICILIIAFYTVGLATNITKFAALVIVVSYANRVPMATFGLDQILAALCLYLCLSPCGERFSVDRWWQQRQRFRIGEDVTWPRRAIGAGLAMRMIQVHLCVIYFWSGISKLKGQSWWSGEAIWRIASNYEYQQVSLTWLATAPWLYQIATVATWVWEISFSFLIWQRRTRVPVLLIGTLMHLSIGLFLGMWTFGLMMTYSYIAFSSPAILRRIVYLLGFGRRLGLSSIPVELSEEGSKEFPEENAPVQTPPLDVPSLPTNVTKVPLRLAVVTDPANQFTNQVSQAHTFADDDQLMLSEHDFDNVVLYVDSSIKRRSAMSEALEAVNIRCIGVDAWPEAIRMYNSLNLHCMLCNASRLQPTELRFWCSHLKRHPHTVHIALIQDIQLPAMKKHDMGDIALQIIPANIDVISKLFDAAATEASNIKVLSPQTHETPASTPSINGNIVKYPSAAR